MTLEETKRRAMEFIRQHEAEQKAMASKGWTRATLVPPQDLSRAGFGSIAPMPDDTWVVCRCGQRTVVSTLEPGEWMLLPCGQEFLRCDPGGFYVLLTEPPDEAYA